MSASAYSQGAVIRARSRRMQPKIQAVGTVVSLGETYPSRTASEAEFWT